MKLSAHQEIAQLFGCYEPQGPGTCPWNVDFLENNGAHVSCGTEYLGMIWQDHDGKWFCKNDKTSDIGPPADNIMNAITTSVGGGLQNTLTNKTRAELRKVMVGYFERAIMAKAPK